MLRYLSVGPGLVQYKMDNLPPGTTTLEWEAELLYYKKDQHRAMHI